mgnify:FL=1
MGSSVADDDRQTLYHGIMAGAFCVVCGVVSHYAQDDHDAEYIDSWQTRQCDWCTCH